MTACKHVHVRSAASTSGGSDEDCGIDVHKKVLMVVVVDARAPEEKPARRRFVTLPSELQRYSGSESG